MSWPLGALLSLHTGGHAPLDTLVSETHVARALKAEGLHVAGFSLWALRRHARREDPIERLLRQPKDWTWLVFAPLRPHDISARDAELLARLAHGLHGVQFLHWSASESGVTFTAYSLRTTVIRGTPVLLPSPPRPDSTLALPAGPLLPDLTRWASVPEARFAAALIEGAYVERLAGAERGAFTNVDVLALDSGTPVVVEVKRRVRSEAHAGDALTMTVTQAGTLGHLAAAGAEVHVAVLVSPTGSARHPEEAVRRGRWQAGAPLIRPGWGERYVDLWGAAEPVSLASLRRAREVAQATPSVQATPTTPRPAPDRRVRRSSGPPAGPFFGKGSPARGSLPARLPEPRRLTSFSFEYAFLRAWTPAPVRLGGRLYPTLAAVFLAARTLDAEARDALTGALTPGPALQLAGAAGLDRAAGRRPGPAGGSGVCCSPRGVPRSGASSWSPPSPSSWPTWRSGVRRWRACKARSTSTCCMPGAGSSPPSRPLVPLVAAHGACGHDRVPGRASRGAITRTVRPAPSPAWGNRRAGVRAGRPWWRSPHVAGPASVQNRPPTGPERGSWGTFAAASRACTAS